MREVDRALERWFATANSRPHPPTRTGAPQPHVAFPPDAERGPGGPARTTLRFAWPPLVQALVNGHQARFEGLVSALFPNPARPDRRVVLFTSCQHAEGRSTLVLALARALADRGEKALLVDADLTTPSIGLLLGLSPRPGLEDVVLGRCGLAEAVRTRESESLHILPLRGPVERPRDLLASPGWSLLLARARREYAIVLLDGSPLFAGVSASLLHRFADVAVLAVDRSRTNETAILRAQEVLEAGGLPLLGLAETFSRAEVLDPAPRDRVPGPGA